MFFTDLDDIERLHARSSPSTEDLRVNKCQVLCVFHQPSTENEDGSRCFNVTFGQCKYVRERAAIAAHGEFLTFFGQHRQIDSFRILGTLLHVP